RLQAHLLEPLDDVRRRALPACSTGLSAFHVLAGDRLVVIAEALGGDCRREWRGLATRTVGGCRKIGGLRGCRDTRGDDEGRQDDAAHEALLAMVAICRS